MLDQEKKNMIVLCLEKNNGGQLNMKLKKDPYIFTYLNGKILGKGKYRHVLVVWDLEVEIFFN